MSAEIYAYIATVNIEYKGFEFNAIVRLDEEERDEVIDINELIPDELEDDYDSICECLFEEGWSEVRKMKGLSNGA